MKKWIWVGLIGLVGCTESEQTKRDRFFLKGNEALKMRQWDEAIREFDKALAVDPQFAQAYNNRGVAKIEDGKAPEAIQDYNQAIAIDSFYWDAVFNRAYAYEETGRLEQALQDIRRAKGHFPDSAYVHFYEGLLLSQQRKYAESELAFLQSLRWDSANLETRVNLATLAFFQQRLEESKAALLQILKVNPQQVDALNTLSQVYLKAGDFQNALITINEALRLMPSEAYFLNNRGQVFLQMDSLRLAEQDINRSILMDPANAWAYRNKGVWALKKGDYPQAIRLLKDALSRKTFIDEIYGYLGEAYRLNGELGQACDAWKTGLREGEITVEAQITKYCRD